jgi:SPP1 gp7 family putative phage head morphogenesis protein
MASTQTFLKNATTRHAVFVERLAGGELNKLIPFLNRVQRETIAKLSGKELTSYNRYRLRRLYAGIDDLLQQAYAEMGETLKDGMTELGKYEAEFNAKMYTKATSVEFVIPSVELIEAAVLKSPISLLAEKNINIDGALKEFSKAKRQEIIGTIKQGVVAGKTNQEIVKDIGFVTQSIQRNHARSLVRTLANHTSASARDSVMQQNKDVITGVEWVSTLDSRTTDTCKALDGQFFADGEGVRPPVHWGCRSTTIPKVKQEYSLSIDEQLKRKAKGSDGKEEVPFTQTYNSWLKQQSNDFQDEVLGATKAKLFREGGLNVKQFVDQNYKPLTLNQLKRKEPLAFEKAGLE